MLYDRVYFKPTENKSSDVFQFFAYGREVNHAKINSSATNLVEFFINVTGLPTEAFGKIVWVADFRLRPLQMNDFPC
jgi:hypothetical protein